MEMTALLNNLRSEMKSVQGKNPSWMWVIDRKILASLVMPDSDPRNRVFYLPLTQMIDFFMTKQAPYMLPPTHIQEELQQRNRIRMVSKVIA